MCEDVVGEYSTNFGKLEIARLLLDHDADTNAQFNDVHRVSCYEYETQETGVRIAELLLKHCGRTVSYSVTPFYKPSYSTT